jgi:3-oxoacyl-[acyl-carrier-protein] synthase II
MVWLTARGVICAHGLGEEALWSGLLAGETRIGPCAALDGRRGAAVPDELLAALPEPDRATAMAAEAARQLLRSPALAGIDRRRLGVCVGTTQGAVWTWEEHQRRRAADPTHRPPPPTLADPTLAVARLLDAAGPVQTLSMACVSGTAAIGIAAGWIRSGICDAAVAGGVDALSCFVHDGFYQLRAMDPDQPRPFDRDRHGLGVGEGAALVLLEAAPREGALRLAGCGLSSDAHHLTGPDPTGAGLARAIDACLADGGLRPEAIDIVNAHGTATLFNDLMESKALALALGAHARSAPVDSIKGSIGHTMGAAGAIEAVLCALALERGCLPATVGLSVLDPAIELDVVSGEARRGAWRCALSTSAGFGGINAALALQRE